MDIDKFKVINDTKGHAAGDRVIKKIGQIIRGSIRSTDCAYRIGGDEFAILSDSTHVMDRVKTGFEANGLNVSIGYAEFTTKDNRIQVYEQVDHALYKDKSLHNLYT
jgi:diguanylate cyclase (GGDEF)-like protein